MARRFIGAIVLGSLLALLGVGAASGQGPATITSAGPLTAIAISDTLNCSVNHTGDTYGEFYLGTACGTFLAVGGVLYGPAAIPAGQNLDSPQVHTAFTPVSQSAVTGTGTASDPFKIVTVVDAGQTGFRITETDSYVVGQEAYRTDVSISNATGAGAILYRAGDCFLQNSDKGYGRVDPATGAVACTVDQTPSSRIEQWFPLTSGSSYVEAFYSTVWSDIASRQSFPNTCECSTLQDNGAGLSWSITGTGPKTVSHLTTFSPTGIVPLTMTKTADAASATVGSADGYTITISNPNTTSATVSSLFDDLPSGFSYTDGSTTGATTADPSVSGQRLTWSGIVVPASGSGSIHFRVTVSPTPGSYSNSASGDAGTFALAPTGPTAPIDVTPPIVVTAPHFRLTVGVTGRGKVTTSGISCSTPASCHGDYPAGSSITLVGVPEPGVTFRNWGGACASFGAQDTCTLLMDNDKNVSATFSTDPVIGDLPPCSPGLQAPCEASQLPGPKESLAVSLSGADGGKVTGGPSGGAHTLASSQDTAPPITCSADSYVCYGDYGTGQSVTLKAKPAPGFLFTGWTGACKGKQLSCTVSLSEARNITAAFAPKGKRVLNLSMKVAAFHVGWKASVGSGELIVTGSIARPAQLIFDLRRPLAGPLVHLTRAVTRAGAFRIPLRLPSRLFPKGAKLLPGGKVISIRGKARGFYVPMQVRTVPLHGPPEGVVRRSFASVTRAGRNVPVLPASSKVAWANFQLEQQPAASLGVNVYWFQPNGHVLGSVRKANRPVVSSFLRSGQPLPRGCWRAELWAGGKRVKRQIVRIGTKRC